MSEMRSCSFSKIKKTKTRKNIVVDEGGFEL